MRWDGRGENAREERKQQVSETHLDGERQLLQETGHVEVWPRTAGPKHSEQAFELTRVECESAEGMLARNTSTLGLETEARKRVNHELGGPVPVVGER